MRSRTIAALTFLTLATAPATWADDEGLSQPGAAVATPAVAVDTGVKDLKKTLAEVLKARRQEEFDYLDRVVTFVDQGKLPREMVESTFAWARKKPQHQFQYFEAALRVRAKTVGVEL